MLAVHDAIEVVTLYAVGAATTVDVVPVPVVGVERVAAGSGVDVVATRAGEAAVTTGGALYKSAPRPYNVSSPDPPRSVSALSVRPGVSSPLPPFLVTAIAISTVNARIASPPRTTKPASSCSLPSRRLLQAYFLAITFPGEHVGEWVTVPRRTRGFVSGIRGKVVRG